MLPVRADKHAMHRDPPPATVNLVPVTDGAEVKIVTGLKRRFVLALARYGGHVDPAAALTLTGTCPGTPPLSATAAGVQQPWQNWPVSLATGGCEASPERSRLGGPRAPCRHAIATKVPDDRRVSIGRPRHR